jgi:hypothetical protein
VAIAAAAAGTVSFTISSIRELPGNHVLQATSASRPTADSTPYPGISADGFDDSMTCATGGGGNAGILICAAITLVSTGTAQRIWNDAGTNTGYVLGLNAANQIALTAGNGVAFTAATGGVFPVGETHVLTGWDDGVNLNVQLDNGAVTSAARPVVSAGTAGFTVFKQNGAAALFVSGDLHQLVYKKNGAGTAAERAALKRYVGAKVGLAL